MVQRASTGWFTDLLEDEQQAKQQIKKATEERDQFLGDLAETFGTDHGRRVLMEIIKDCFLYQTVFTGNSATYYRAGIQDFGRRLLDAVAAADPDTYLWLSAQRANQIFNRFSSKLTKGKLATDEK